MANYQIAIVVLLILIVSGIHCNLHDDDDGEDDVFVPTNDWQIVKKGQKIPQGLHVRMDLSTGVTEAKLLDENEKNSNSIIHVPQSDDGDVGTIESKQISKSALKDRIEKLLPNVERLDPEKVKSIKDKFRNYEELKKTLDEINLTPRLDSEIIAELLIKHDELLSLSSSSSINSHRDEILRILEDLDYLTHQYDNAIEFVNKDGFNRLIYKNLNSTNNEIRSATLKLLVTITQNNNKPKIHALETGTIVVLLRFINSDPDVGIKLRALTALSSLLRSFPVAQRKFIENGGFSTIIKYFDTDINNNINIQIKIITMISDLITEHRFAADDDKLKPYYYSFDLIKYVLEQNWCEILNKLLYRLIIVDNQDHDSIEKCLIAMHSLRQQCGVEFDKKLLTSVRLQYKILNDVEIDEENDFFNSLKQLCDEILLNIVNNYTVKTEL